jgi:hypothetical protein
MQLTSKTTARPNLYSEIRDVKNSVAVELATVHDVRKRNKS